MKTSRIFVICLGIAVLSACQGRETLEQISEEKVPLSLSGDIEQQLVTRASANGFAEGDQVGIWAVNYDGETPGILALNGNQATNVRFTFDGTSTWTPDYDVYYKDKNTKVDIYGMYPYSSAISSIEALPFEVQEDQSTVSAHGIMGGYEASDFLWVKRESVLPSPSAIQLNFKHKMSCVVVTLVEGEGFEEGEFASLGKSVLVNNVKRTATINLATGAVTAIGSVPSRSTVPAVFEQGYRAIVVPQTVVSSATLFSITLGGVAYTYSTGEAFTYVAGKQHNFAVTIDKKADGGYAVSVSTTISAWTNDTSSHDFTAKEYVVVNVETAGTLGETLTNAGKNPNEIKYMKVLGTVNADDFSFMRGMSKLQGINMKETKISENRIPDNAFRNKASLVTFVFPDGVHDNPLTSIGMCAFESTSINGLLVIPEGVETIKNSAFRGTQISNITFPASLITISDEAFRDCSYLLGPLYLPDSLEEIKYGAFRGCGAISGELILPETLHTIGMNAFYECSSLTGSLTIPSKVKVVSSSAFFRCGFSGSLCLSEGIEQIESNAFQYSGFQGELYLPSTLIKIAGGAFNNVHFHGEVTLPESLITIESGCFSYCNGLVGTVEFPESILNIPSDAFKQCTSLERLVLPQELLSIGSNAFGGCTGLQSIVCLAENPPAISSSTFGSVPKNNFTLEVPESSVNDYSYATGWNEFESISAHREFSISRRIFRTLNHSESKQIVVKAESGAAWSIDDENLPDWITVSPSSGTGKTDVTVTISDLSPGADNRQGEVTFVLDGKNYTSVLAIEQRDYTYGDGAVLTEQTHTLGSGIPIVFMGDCYDAVDISSGNYLTDLRQAITHFFDIEPYTTYRNYFDVYIVVGQSEDSGVGSESTIRDSKFGTKIFPNQGFRLADASGTEIFNYAKKIDAGLDLSQALIVLVPNSTLYGGVTYLWGDGSAIAICPKSSSPYPYDFRGIVQHEAGGHGFGKLADEYIYTASFIGNCGCHFEHLSEFLTYKSFGFYKNLSETNDRDAVPWSHLMYHPNYSNKVDIYEGGFFHTRGIYRSESNSCMNNNISYYSAISRQAIVERIMEYSGVGFDLNVFYTNDEEIATKAANAPTSTGSVEFVPNANNNHHHPIFMGDHPIL